MSDLPETMTSSERIYLDHAATTPVSDAARAAMLEGLAIWANPSSPHAEGRAARAALEDARARIKAALGWTGAVILTAGASEAIALGIGRAKVGRVMTSAVEHDAVMRVTKDAGRLRVKEDGCVSPSSVRAELVEASPFLEEKNSPSTSSGRTEHKGVLVAIQHVNSETGVIQPLDSIAIEVRQVGGILFVDYAQGAGKLPLPDADLIAIGAHKFGGPPGVGALLVRDLALLEPTGGQEQGYRGGTENLPAVLGMAAALEESSAWRDTAVRLRARLDAAIEAEGGEVVAKDSLRLATIASYRMPGVPARAQLIRFDLAGIAVSAGSACSSGTLKTSPVLAAMGWDEAAASEVIRVSFGRDTDDAAIDRFLTVWRELRAGGRSRAA